MQRKNSILKIYPQTKRGAFAMIMAIFVIIIISTIMALSLSLTTQTSKRTTDIYLYEQAELVAKSATERALLEIANNGCQNTFTTDTGMFDISVTMQYIYTGVVVGCTPYNPASPIYITTPEQNGSVLMDVEVTVKNNITTEPIRYFRRSIQKL